MYKVYIQENALTFSDTLDAACEGEVLILSSGASFHPTKLLEKVQFTKLLQVISPEFEHLFSLFRDSLPLIQAGGGITRNEKGDVLMIHRWGRWDLPKGKLEKGERIDECAVREVEEECALQGVECEEFLTDTYHCYLLNEKWALKKTSWYRMRYRGTETPSPQTEEGIDEAGFIPQAELSNKLQHAYGTIRDIFARDGSLER